MSGKEYFEKKNAEKRDEQKLYDIRWNVNKIEMTDCKTYDNFPKVSVEVTGIIRSIIGSVKLEDIAVELQNRLNNGRDDSVEIKKVIFNPPATIVLWSDDTKTVVKTQNGEEFDLEKGLAMAMVKKVMGNKGNYFNEIKKWTEQYSATKFDHSVTRSSDSLIKWLTEAMKATENINKLTDAFKKIQP